MSEKINTFGRKNMQLHTRQIGSGYPLVMLHGLFGSSDNMLGPARHYATAFQVYIPDMRNHGRSPHHNTMNYYAMADDILTLFEEHNISKAVLMGHSMGGKAAMQFAVENPGRVAALVVADMGVKAYPLRHIQYINAMKSLCFDNITSRHEAGVLLQQNITDEAIVQLLLKNLEWKNDKRLGWRLNLDALYNNIDNILAALDINSPYKGPVLFVRGEWSDYIKAEDTVTLQGHFPEMHLVTIPEAGHWVHADNPALFLAAVDEFLAPLNFDMH